MRILIFEAEQFEFTAEQAGSPLAASKPVPEKLQLQDAGVAFVHVEPADEARNESLIKQADKYFQWFLRKRDLDRILLHSFAHLGEERGSPEFARQILDAISERLSRRYEVSQTPFGYSLTWTLSTPGHPYAKTFKQL